MPTKITTRVKKGHVHGMVYDDDPDNVTGRLSRSSPAAASEMPLKTVDVKEPVSGNTVTVKMKDYSKLPKGPSKNFRAKKKGY